MTFLIDLEIGDAQSPEAAVPPGWDLASVNAGDQGAGIHLEKVSRHDQGHLFGWMIDPIHYPRLRTPAVSAPVAHAVSCRVNWASSWSTITRKGSEST